MRHPPPRQRKSDDTVHRLKVTLEEMYKGGLRKLQSTRRIKCPECNASGSKSGKKYQCGNCHGSGTEVKLRQLGPGMVQQIQQQCPDCGGTGYSFKKQKERQVLEVHIEPGMNHEEKIRFPGMSDEQPNTEPGDIVFVLQEKVSERGACEGWAGFGRVWVGMCVGEGARSLAHRCD